MYYSSTNNDFIKNIKKLHIKKYRDINNLFLIEGEHLVEEAIKNNCIKYIIIKENYSFDTTNNINKITVSEKVLRYISNLDNPQPIMAVCYKKNQSKIGKKIIILDGIQDPGNIGTIIRSCVAFGIDTIILNDTCVDPYSPKVTRASQGMIFNINLLVTNLETMILSLKKMNYAICGTDVKTGIKLKCFEKIEKFAIIMGNEGSGVSDNVKKLIDKNIYIPMNKFCESLNVGVAASIIMYELGDL